MTTQSIFPTDQTTPVALGKSRWKEAIAPYQRSELKRSVWQLVNSLGPFTLLWISSYLALGISYWISLTLSIFAAGFLVRVFIISHDCGHGSFFRSNTANQFWGRITSFLVLIPYHAWRHSHALHHAQSGNLDNRGSGDINTWTVDEYKGRTRMARLGYRLYRHPLVLLGIGPIFIFVISYRFWPKGGRPQVRSSVITTNLAILGVLTLVGFTIGIRDFLLVQAPITVLAGVLGVWLFYVQHQFEGVYWQRNADWDFFDQATRGSSYYKLPKILQWFSGNIGFHHIHHLGARIPNYFLEKVQREVKIFRKVKPMTLRASFKCAKFRLWDEKNRRLVGFSHLKKSS